MSKLIYLKSGQDQGAGAVPKDALDAQREYETRFRDLVEGSLQGIMVTRGYELIFANQALADILGYTVDEIVGLESWAQLVSPEERQRVSAYCAARAEGGDAPMRYEYQAIRKDGSAVWLENLSRRVTWSGEEVTQATVIDITKRKQAETALKESEARYRTLADFASEAVLINDGQTLIDANRAAERMYGYTREELIGKPVGDLIASGTRDLVSGVNSWRSEVTCKGVALRKDGTTFEAAYQPRLIEYQGKPHRFIAVRDISARKAMDRMKDELISVISHELRTPLTSIRGSLGLAAGGALGEMSEGAQEMIEMALKNTERLTVLVNHILDMEKASAGRLEIDPKPIDMVETVRQAIETNTGLAQEYEISFVLGETPETAPVIADADRIAQVMANLLSNGAKFSPAGGQVRVGIKRNATMVRVVVRDDGPGVPDAFKDHLFDKFTQADSTDARDVPGSGLGLYISKAIIDEHGGDIGFEREFEGGTTFHFDLPLRDA